MKILDDTSQYDCFAAAFQKHQADADPVQLTEPNLAALHAADEAVMDIRLRYAQDGSEDTDDWKERTTRLAQELAMHSLLHSSTKLRLALASISLLSFIISNRKTLRARRETSKRQVCGWHV